VPIELKPLQHPHPPMWYATNSPESARRVGEQNMNLASLLAAPEARAVIDAFKESWSRTHGRTDRKIPKAGIARNVYVAETDREAEERGKFGSKGFYESLVYLWRKYNVSHVSLEEVLRASASTLITGTPETVRTRIEQELEQSGANYMIVRFAYGNLTDAESTRSLELFATEVLPHFQK
jgi:alkanesulfonate monooxygenase SsuD/methylene tetrahydromethanopterin reductase-like flavin-dependent oxidoreductase (luciferase family)